MPIIEFLPVFILFLLIFVVFNPIFWLIFLPLIALVVIYFISIEFFIMALINLIVVPQQIIAMFKNPVLRKNHALEHATINVLEERYGKLPNVGGLADTNGFYIYSSQMDLPPDILLSAAKEGLKRLKKGERYLAIHERCGTSIAVTNFILSLFFIIVFIWGGYFSFINIIMAIIFIFLVSKPLGKLAQKYITTDPDVKDIEITGIKVAPFVKYFGIPVPVFTNRFFITTYRIPKVHRIW